MTWIRPSGQYSRPPEETEIYLEVTGGSFMNPWDAEPEVERRLLQRYTDEQLTEIYKDVWKPKDSMTERLGESKK